MTALILTMLAVTPGQPAPAAPAPAPVYYLRADGSVTLETRVAALEHKVHGDYDRWTYLTRRVEELEARLGVTAGGSAPAATFNPDRFNPTPSFPQTNYGSGSGCYTDASGNTVCPTGLAAPRYQTTQYRFAPFGGRFRR